MECEVFSVCIAFQNDWESVPFLFKPRHRRKNKIFGCGGENLNYDLAKQEVANFYGACNDIVVKILNLSVNSKRH